MSDDKIQPERPDPYYGKREPREPLSGRDTGADASDLPKLGSLAQTARGKHIQQARTVLLVVGILMVVAQGILYFVEKAQLQDEIRKLHGMADPVRVAEVERLLMLFHGGAIAAGLAMIVLSFFVKQHPVPITSV